MSKYYPDISHHHTVADWDKVEKNCPFLITKATQGTSFVDSAMAGIVKQCEKRGVPYWLYAYLNKGDELAQAKFLVKTCKDKIGKHFMGYVLDVEAGNTASGVQKAMDYLKTLDYKMMVYTMYAQYDKYKNILAARPGKCAWWEARYGLNNGKYDAAYPCHAGADLHQYTSEGTCPGFDEKIDLNRVTGQGKKEEWFVTPKQKDETSGEETVTKPEDSTGGDQGNTGQEGESNVKYFSTIKNDTVSNITDFLHNRGLGAGENNMSAIAAVNCQSKEVRKALFALAEQGKLIKPSGLNKWEKSDKE